MHKGAEAGARGHEHKRTVRPAAQRLQAPIRGWPQCVQRSRVIASTGVAVQSWGWGWSCVVIGPLQEVHSGDPSRPLALLWVHVKEGAQWRRGSRRGQALQVRAGPGSEH